MLTQIRISFLTIALVLLSATVSQALAQRITVGVWNIENLGSGGRGFALGYGQGSIPMRTPEQLKAIARFISVEMKADLLAIQEVAVSRTEKGRSISDPLELIIKELGSSWRYYLPPVDSVPSGHGNMFCGFLWNQSKVHMESAFPAEVPDMVLGGNSLFPRVPVVGHFEIRPTNLPSTDFVIFNLHLKSGSHFDENHLIAMTVLEYNMNTLLASQGIREADRLVLGDFNDNPFVRWGDGTRKYSSALYEHMRFKGYRDLVSAKTGQTQMDLMHTNIIDHVLVNEPARRHVLNSSVKIHRPEDPASFAEWRQTYSDHFPMTFAMEGELFDDDPDL